MTNTSSQKTKSEKRSAFIDKWRFVIAFYGIGLIFIVICIWGTTRHYPKLSELSYVVGELEEYSIVDGRNNHRITLKLKQTFLLYSRKLITSQPQKKYCLMVEKLNYG